jgi:hypothetical protein
MPRLRLDPDLTSQRVDELATGLTAAEGEAIDLVLHGAKRTSVGGTARLLGLLARLRRDGHEINLHIHTGNKTAGLRSDSRYWEFFTDELYGIVLATYANAIVTQNGDRVTEELNREQRRALVVKGCELRHGNRIAYVFRDDRPYLRPATLLEGHNVLGAHLRKLMANLNVTWADEASSSLTTYIDEVLSNTVDHAMDVNGRPAGGLRFMEVRRFNFRQLKPSQLAGATDVELTDYVTQVRPRDGEDLKLVEITIADAGPGIAATMSGHTGVFSGSLDEEERLVRHAFTRMGTSKRDGDPYAGNGLVEALESCRTLDALLTVRTGRFQLWRHYLDGAPAGRDFQSRQMPLVAGTSISALMPQTTDVSRPKGRG